MPKNLLLKAIQTAQIAHHGQFRKSALPKAYPYFNHPDTVAKLVKYFGGSDADQIVAYLHDVVEDCSYKGYSLAYIEKKFGKNIARRVDELTNKKIDPQTGAPLSREEWKERKKEIQVYHASRMDRGNQLVKACDQISNIIDFGTLEPFDTVEFRINYLEKAYAVIQACYRQTSSFTIYADRLYVVFSEFLTLEEKGLLKENLPAARSKLRKVWLSF